MVATKTNLSNLKTRALKVCRSPLVGDTGAWGAAWGVTKTARAEKRIKKMGYQNKEKERGRWMFPTSFYRTEGKPKEGTCQHVSPASIPAGFCPSDQCFKSRK